MTAMDVPTGDRKACRACQADILFAQTNKVSHGQPVLMPVDCNPSPKGNVLLTKTGTNYTAGVLGRNQAAGARDSGQELHTSHFATCTQPARFRKIYEPGKR